MKFIQTLSAFTLAAAIASCSGEKQTAVAVPEGMTALDLSGYGKPFSIFVPDTAKSPCVIGEDPSGALLIESGPAFGISIYEQAADLELKRRDISEDEVNKLQSFILDTTDAIVWESRIVNPEFHFVVNRKVNGSDYSFEDIRRQDDSPGYRKEAIMRMYNSSRNIVVKEDTGT